MKTRYLLSILLITILPFSIFGQVIPNMDFEDWDNSLGYDDPDGWATPNTFGAVLGLFNVFEETDNVQNGSSAARMETIFVELLGQSAPGVMTNGEIVFDLSNPDDGGYKGGSPIDYRPESLAGYYLYEPADNDTASILIQLLRGDLESGTQEIVGESELVITGTSTDYEMFDMDINYLLSGNPDTVVIFMTGSRNPNNAQTGTVFRVDNLSLEGMVSGIHDQTSQVKFDLYPNPAVHEIHINNPLPANLKMDVFNIIGKLMQEFTIAPGANLLDVSDFYEGIYLYRIHNEQENISSGKFKVNR